ncbi:hypothetical protein HCC61_26410 [Streptomyces sp. HNM0575]|nr:hypothetical protein [Streptomyces sp. HNM0575]NLU76138.1 hypothetical protein [Streptomyces sp. HNM0575]
MRQPCATSTSANQQYANHQYANHRVRERARARMNMSAGEHKSASEHSI